MSTSKRVVHYCADAPADYSPVSTLYPAICRATFTEGLKITSAEQHVTCVRCLRHLRGEVHNIRDRPQLSRIPLGEQADDGVSRWCAWHGRYWRVWPLPGRDAGWHLEEVDAEGNTAGHVALDRRDPRAPFKWVGGHYEVVGTLSAARETIAELSA